MDGPWTVHVDGVRVWKVFAVLGKVIIAPCQTLLDNRGYSRVCSGGKAVVLSNEVAACLLACVLDQGNSLICRSVFSLLSSDQVGCFPTVDMPE